MVVKDDGDGRLVAHNAHTLAKPARCDMLFEHHEDAHCADPARQDRSPRSHRDPATRHMKTRSGPAKTIGRTRSRSSAMPDTPTRSKAGLTRSRARPDRGPANNNGVNTP